MVLNVNTFRFPGHACIEDLLDIGDMQHRVARMNRLGFECVALSIGVVGVGTGKKNG